MLFLEKYALLGYLSQWLFTFKEDLNFLLSGLNHGTGLHKFNCNVSKVNDNAA